MRQILEGFRPYEIDEVYAGFPLKVQIADPLAGGWYGHTWGPMPEIDLLKSAGLIPGARVFDIGAHQGIVAMILARHVGPSGEVVAVEALPHNARMIEANRNLNGLRQIRVESAAIAERPGVLELAADLNAQVNHRASRIGTTRVPAITIDDLADKYGHPDILFIDVEGYECHALRGAARVLARHPDCYVEIHRGFGLESFGGTVGDVFAYFSPNRYSLFAWSDEDPRMIEVAGSSDCPEGGRVFLVAIRRER